jgi:hypothetical protein
MFHALYVVIYSISINNLDHFILIIYDDVTDSIMDLFNKANSVFVCISELHKANR